MTSTRQTTRRIATLTAALVDLVIAGLIDDFDTCDLCGLDAAELYTRIDNRDHTEIGICETCADTADVSYVAE
jgi:hypothetical protein